MRRPAYRIGERLLQVDSPGFGEAIAAAHADHLRPRCMCLGSGIEMYIARLAGSPDGYVVKRMPDTGRHHAPNCTSYERPPEASGLAQVLGSAISDDPSTGQTTLKLDFALSKMARRSAMPPSGVERDSVASSGARLSLRGLLHYLWGEAELTHWHPGFAGKRTWGTVRSHLLHAAANKIACGQSLGSRLFVPEVFSIERRDAIDARRVARWAETLATRAKQQHLLLLIGEVKQIVPARYGFKAVLKHMPDQAFSMDEQLFRRLSRRFERELALWGTAADTHLVAIATFSVGTAGLPAIAELSLMPVTRQWLPIENAFEKQLIGKLVDDGRSFIKGLRYNLDESTAMACATLTDCGETAPLLFVEPIGLEAADGDHPPPDSSPVWSWTPAGQAIPALPPPHPRATVDRGTKAR